jgi:hypothetical protein
LGAIIASLIETCKLNAVDPQHYLAEFISKNRQRSSQPPDRRSPALGLSRRAHVQGSGLTTALTHQRMAMVDLFKRWPKQIVLTIVARLAHRPLSDNESRPQRNHIPPKFGIPNGKKSDIHTRLSCKIEYLSSLNEMRSINRFRILHGRVPKTQRARRRQNLLPSNGSAGQTLRSIFLQGL